MARRIIVAMVALVCVMLAGAVIPLGIIAVSHDQHDFRSETVNAATLLSSVAEEDLGDHRRDTTLNDCVTRAQRTGEQVTVYDKAGRWFLGDRQDKPAATSAMLTAATRHGRETTLTHDDRVLTVVPVPSDERAGTVGVVALTRSTVSLSERVDVLWTWLALVAVGGLAAAAVTATTLARWVSHPLHALDVAARQLGGGALDTRAPTGRGPAEVSRLATTFNAMASRLATLIGDHRAMMADVSHQLRTPLTALRLRLDVLAQDADEATATELTGAQAEIARLSRLVDGLLAVARAENAVVTPRAVDVAELVRERVGAWRPVAEDRAVRLTARGVEDGPVLARLGDGHLPQILDNLLANALDAVRPDGHVTVVVARFGARVRVRVVDDGPGMSPRQRQAAFRRFGASAHEGAGLGLAIVHRLVTSNGGAVSLAETRGGGLTVRLDLPAVARPTLR